MWFYCMLVPWYLQCSKIINLSIWWIKVWYQLWIRICIRICIKRYYSSRWHICRKLCICWDHSSYWCCILCIITQWNLRSRLCYYLSRSIASICWSRLTSWQIFLILLAQLTRGKLYDHAWIWIIRYELWNGLSQCSRNKVLVIEIHLNGSSRKGSNWHV